MTGNGSVGVIDIGSNSVRLVVYERLARSPTPFFNEKVLAGLGRSVAETGNLDEDGVKRTEQALKRFRFLADQMGVRQLDVLATAAAREADNGPDFIAMAERICGVHVRVLTGEEEANLAGLGVLSGIPDADGLCGDLGGGSLELVEISEGAISVGETFPLGGLRLQHTSGGDMKKARRIARSELASSGLIDRLKDRSLYTIGGTWRSLAKLHMEHTGYPLHVMQHYRMDARKIRDFLKTLARGDLSAFDKIEVVSRQRQALLPYGAAVLLELIEVGKPRDIVTSALGLREGFLYSRLDDEQKAEDPLISAAEELAELRSRSLAHARELIGWTRQAMEAAGVAETGEEARLRSAACLLSDIGWRAHPDYRGEQSLNIIANAAFVGLDHPGRAYLAMAVYYRHSGLSESDLSPAIRDLAPRRYREQAKVLAAILRVGYLISASMPGVVPRTRIIRDGKTLVLELPDDLSMLAGGRLESRMKQLGNVCELNSEIRTAGG
jgi:exopolyphosphatase/guanosine-5'-triphosphate,3'-diphosphate pyrophosphatase